MRASTPATLLARFLAIQALRYVAATQSFAMVFFHAGWILLAMATWGGPDGAHGGVGAVTRVLVQAFVWLGGVDARGHGDGDTLMVVWARLALAVYLLDTAWRRLFGTPRPIGLRRIAVGSWLLAQVGYIVAMVPTGDLAEAAIVLLLFPLLAALATVWAVAMRRLAQRLEDRIRGGRARADPAPASGGRAAGVP